MASVPPRSVVHERAARAAQAALEALGLRRLDPPGPDVDRFIVLCASLHRLDLEIARLRASDRRTPALYHRLSSASLAYDAVLRETGEVIGLPVPPAVPFEPAARLEVEAALAAAGVWW
jgi:hypothetical protein